MKYTTDTAATYVFIYQPTKRIDIQSENFVFIQKMQCFVKDFFMVIIFWLYVVLKGTCYYYFFDCVIEFNELRLIYPTLYPNLKQYSQIQFPS